MYRQRRLAALGVLAALVAVIGALVGSGHDTPQERSAAAPAVQEQQPPELPRGGRSIFPEFRVVAYYGAPQSAELGTLGIGSPAAAAGRLEEQAKPYATPGRPALPALELIAVIANADAGATACTAPSRPTR